MADCVTGKALYLTEELAEQALIDAWIRNDYPAGKGPVAIYRCPDCRYFHFTSSGDMNPALAQFIRDGKLKLEREARRWRDKLGH